MKRLITLLALFLALWSISSGQAVRDSTRGRDRQKSRQMTDQNGDGINDRMFGQQRRLRQGMDRFIDANGDGISDSRECGLGFRRGTIEQPMEPGKQGMRKGQKGK